MANIGTKQYYADLLYEESFIRFLKRIISTEKDPTLLTVAKEILFAVQGNKIIAYKPYYDGFYKKYKLLLRNSKSADSEGGLKIIVDALDGNNRRAMGTMSSLKSPLPLPPTINVNSVVSPESTPLNPKKPRIPPSKPPLPTNGVGPIFAGKIATPSVFDQIKNKYKLGDFLDYSPNTEKIDVGGLNLSQVTLAEIFIVIYSVFGYPVWWINKYTKRIFDSSKGFSDRPNGYTDHWDRSDKKTVWDYDHPGKNPSYQTQEFGNYWKTTNPCPDTTNPPVYEFVDPDYKKNDCNNSTLFYEYNEVTPRNKEITSLDFSNTDVTSITVKDLPNLKHFKADFCKNLTSIDLSGAPNLEEISISIAESLTSLTVSSTKLEAVTIFTTKISSINFLKNLTSLKIVYMNSNSLTTLDLSNCTNLAVVSLVENGLTSVNLTGCTSLKILSLDKNELTTLDISNCIYLKKLYAPYNFLTTLDISNNSSLKGLNLSFNELTQNAVDDILQKMSQFTDTRADFAEGFIHLYGGFNARPSFGTDVLNAGGMGYYIDLVAPYLSVPANLYDEGASNLSPLLVNHILTLYEDKHNYAVLPIVDYVPIKNWRIGPPPDMAYKSWDVLISRENLKLIIFGTYQ